MMPYNPRRKSQDRGGPGVHVTGVARRRGDDPSEVSPEVRTGQPRGECADDQRQPPLVRRPILLAVLTCAAPTRAQPQPSNVKPRFSRRAPAKGPRRSWLCEPCRRRVSTMVSSRWTSRTCCSRISSRARRRPPSAVHNSKFFEASSVETRRCFALAAAFQWIRGTVSVGAHQAREATRQSCGPANPGRGTTE
jgi:hypothetical protein